MIEEDVRVIWQGHGRLTRNRLEQSFGGHTPCIQFGVPDENAEDGVFWGTCEFGYHDQRLIRDVMWAIIKDRVY